MTVNNNFVCINNKRVLELETQREAENVIIRLRHLLSEFVSIIDVKESDSKTLELLVTNGKAKWKETVINWQLKLV